MLDALARWNRWGTARLDPGIPRDVLSEVRPFLQTRDVVALIGPRRAGKTTVLFQTMDALAAKGVSPQAMLHVNLEEPGFAGMLGIGLLDRLYEAYRVSIHPRGRSYLFLDEVQRIPEWERWVRARTETEDLKVYVTGSSAALLSLELGTLLTGRHVALRVMPLGFAEFLRFTGVSAPAVADLVSPPIPVRRGLLDWLRWGGLPEVVLADDDRRREVLLRQYFDDILFKDVALRHSVRDVGVLRALAVHLLTSTAGLVSFQRLARQFEVSLDMVRSYCGFLEEAFLVRFLPFFSLKAAERQRRPQKVHAVDLGVRNAVCLSASPDLGRLAETAVVNALDREPHDGLFYWKERQEADLVLRRGLEAAIVAHVAWSVERPEAKARELAAIEEARAAFPKASTLLVVGEGALPVEGRPRPKSRTLPLWRLLLHGTGRPKSGR
ncbi:MAG: ATP-binding protein [Planctomycetota bacterium]